MPIPAGQGGITVPGCLAATAVEAPIDVEEGLTSDAPLVYYLGAMAGQDVPALYRHGVECLAGMLAKREEASVAQGLKVCHVVLCVWLKGPAGDD